MKKNDKPQTLKQLAGLGLAENLRRLMKERQITQTRLSQLSGVPQSTIATILLGKANQMEWYTLYRLSQGLGCLMEDIIEGTETRVIDNPDVKRIIEAMPPGAKAFFRISKKIHPDDVEAVIRIMETIVEKHKKQGKKES